MEKVLAIVTKTQYSICMGKGTCRQSYNNRCDELATRAADRSNLPADVPYESDID